MISSPDPPIRHNSYTTFLVSDLVWDNDLWNHLEFGIGHFTTCLISIRALFSASRGSYLLDPFEKFKESPLEGSTDPFFISSSPLKSYIAKKFFSISLVNFKEMLSEKKNSILPYV